MTWMLLLRDYQGHHWQLAATGPLLGGGRWRARIAVTHAVPQALLTTGTGMSSLSDLGLSRTLKIDDCQAIRRAKSDPRCRTSGRAGPVVQNHV